MIFELKEAYIHSKKDRVRELLKAEDMGKALSDIKKNNTIGT